MTELRTQKDLFDNILMYGKDNLATKEGIQTMEIVLEQIQMLYKQEAVKWIRLCLKKVLSKGNFYCGTIKFDGREHFRSEWFAIIKDRMHFFNISEEDLK